MAPSPLVAFHTDNVAAYTLLAQGAKANLAAAQAALKQAETDMATAAKNIAGQLDARAAVQAKLAAVTLPADATPLLAQLEAIIIELRKQQAAQIAAAAAAAIAGAKADRASAQLTRASAGVASETAALAKAQAQQDEEDKWRTALDPGDTLTALTTAQTDFTAMPKTTPGYVDANTRITTDFPAALLNRARERETNVLNDASQKRTDLANAAASIDTALDTNGGLAGQAAKLQSAFDAKRAALRDVATLALGRIDRALTLLAGVNSSTALTTSEIAAIAALTTAGTVAAGKQKDLEDAITAAGGDLTDPAVIAAQGAYDLVKADLDKWEAAVPDVAWQNLSAFDEAGRILALFAGINLATVASDFDGAANALKAKLITVQADILTRALAQESLIELTVTADRAAAPERIFSALRGDG